MNRNRLIGLVAVAGTMTSAFTGAANAQCYGLKLVDDNPNILSNMGATSDMGQDVLALGAPGFGAGGHINIFERQNGVWNETAEFLSPLNPGEDGYAQSIAVTSVFIAVGAPLTDLGGDTRAGRVYIYYKTPAGAWVLDETIDNPSPDDDDYFGHAVDLRSYAGNPVLVVGCPGDDLPGAANAGRVRVYTRDWTGSWNLHADVTSTTIDADEFFGGAVMLSNDRLIVGAPGEEVGGLTDAGAAYVYERTDDLHFVGGIRFIRPFSDRAELDVFGRTVAIWEDRIAIGAPGHDEGADNDCGAIYVYDYDGGAWSLDEKVIEPSPSAFDRIGTSLDLHADVLVAGDPADENAWIWRRDAKGVWSADPALTAAEPPASGSHNFGSSVALSNDGEHLLIGDSGDDIGAFGNAGSAYLYTADQDPGENCGWEFLDAVPEVTTGIYFGCNGGGTDGLTLCALTHGDVWYQFTAPCNGILRLSTCGTNDLYGIDSGIDTVLSVQQGCETVFLRACNDDYVDGNDPMSCFLDGDQGANRDSALRMSVEAGENYRIRIASYGAAGDTGQFVLNVSFECCRVDWDGNGVVNSTDVSSYINDWFDDQASGTSTTDFNGDGVSNSTDVSDFINEWFAGCGA